MPEVLGPDDAWPCPKLSPHPLVRGGNMSAHIDWAPEHPVRMRVLDHTCSCRVVVYELLGVGGRYMIRRIHQTQPRRELYSGPWTRPVADRVWRLILTGETW